MLDIAEELDRWVGQGRDFAVATVVAVGGSAPRRPGSIVLVTWLLASNRKWQVGSR